MRLCLCDFSNFWFFGAIFQLHSPPEHDYILIIAALQVIGETVALLVTYLCGHELKVSPEILAFCFLYFPPIQ